MDLSLSTVLQSLAFVSGVTGQWLIARRSRHAFVAWTISNVVLIAFSLLSEAWWLLAMYTVYLAGSVFAWWQWGVTQPHQVFQQQPKTLEQGR